MPDGLVTALTADGRGGIAIEVDGEPWLVLPAGALLAEGVAVGDRLDARSRRALEQRGRDARALDRAAAMVARRSHGRVELERKLARRDGAHAAARAAERLAELGVVDDARHAGDLAARRLGDGWGPERIRHDLETAGVPTEVIEQAIAALDDASIDLAARRALGTRTGVEAWRRLASRGFDAEVAERLAPPPADAI